MAAVRTAALVALLVLATAAKHAPPPTEPAAVTPVAPTIKAGVEKWRAGDYAGAVAIWTPFAAAGDADALFNLGQAYKLGRGVTADAATARDYYRKAALKGHLPAQANLGIALFQAGEKPEAIKWLKTAADRGEARAQYVLGIAAFNGDGIVRSQSLGYAYLLRAQASGLPQAATALGTIQPSLSPADRAAGEAAAASLAAGTGVPAGLAAATAPRLIPATPPARTAATLPVVTPPARTLPVVTPPVTAAAPPIAAPSAPVAGALPVRSSPPPAVAPVARPTTTVAADRPTLPPAPKPLPAVPVREPMPAQADAPARVAARGAAPPTTAGVAPVASGTRLATGGGIASAVPAEQRATAPVAAVAVPASRSAADPLAPRPRPAPVEAARAELPSAAPLKPFQTVVEPTRKLDGWRVQLGAFSSRKLADAAWADVKTTAAPAKPLFATDGPVTKLQMGPFATRDAAKAACTKLTAAGRACFVTRG